MLLLLLVAIEGFMVWRVYKAASQQWQPEPADAIIVLGALVYKTGEPAPQLAARIEKARALYEEGLADHIIVCGTQGSDEPATEASVMARKLKETGVPDSAIMEEDQSYNTMQNLQNAKKIMEQRGFEKAIVVTSDYHVTRALWMCDTIGIPATGAGAYTQRTLGFVQSIFRESLSWIHYHLRLKHTGG